MKENVIWCIVFFVILGLCLSFYKLDKRPIINFQGKSYEVVMVYDKYVASDNSVYFQVKEITHE